MALLARSRRPAFGWAILVGAALALIPVVAVPAEPSLTSSSSSVRASGPVGPGFPAAATYPVTFTEQGLPVGASWNLTVLGQTWSTTTRSIVLDEANGSFTYTAASDATPGNWSANGTFDVAGGPVGVLVVLFSANAPSHGAGTPAAASGGPAFVLLVGGTVALLVVVASVVVVARRRRGEGLPPPLAQTPTTRERPPSALDEKPPGDEPPDPLRHML